MACVMLEMSYEPLFVIASIVVACVAGYVTILTLRHFFWSKLMVLLAAFELSVLGIWSMHFVGMTGMTLHYPYSFDPLLTVFSAVFAFVGMDRQSLRSVAWSSRYA